MSGRNYFILNLINSNLADKMHHFLAIASHIGSIQALHYENCICDSTLDPDAAIEANINVKLKFLTKLV